MKFKKTLAAILALCMVLSLAVPVSAAEVVETGTLSENVTYTLYDDQTLVIEGIGGFSLDYEQFPDIQVLEIKEGITELGYNTFWHRPSLRSASVPSTVKELKGTFGNCTALESVTLREGLEVIGADAFLNCRSLRYVYIPSTVTTLGTSAFSGCSSLESIVLPAGLASPGEKSFDSCDSLREIVFLGGPVTLPDSLFTVGSSIDIYYPDGQGWTQEDFKYLGRAATWIPYTLDESGNRIPDESRAYATGVFYSMDDTGALTVSGEGQITYDIKLYNLYSNATSLDIQDGITEIGDSAFAHYPIKSASIAGSVTRIGKGAFDFCYYLTDLVLNEGLQELGESAFSTCTALEEIIIPASVTAIGDQAFRNSDELSSVTFLGDPPAFGEDIFISTSEKSVDLVIYYPDNGNWTQEDLLYLGKTCTWIPYSTDEEGNRIPDESRAYVAEFVAVTSGTFDGGGIWYIDDAGVLHIEGAEYVGDELSHYDHWESITGLETKDLTHAYFTFSDHETLTSVSFSDSMTQAGYFRNCDALTDVDLGNGMQTLLSDMFVDCDSLTTLTIPASVETINDNAVNGCVNLESVTFLGSAPSYMGTGAFSKVGEVVFYYPANDPTWTEEILQTPLGCSAVWTPYTLDVDGKMVIDEAGAVTVHSAVDQWESGDFTCTLYSDGTIKVEGTGDFTGVPHWGMWPTATHIEVCEGITSISSIGSLYSYENEVTVTLASTVTEIGPEAFRGCDAITSLDLRYVTTIGVNAFHASAIETVVLSEQLTAIPEYAFWQGSLKSIVIPDGVTTIGENAFNECLNLEYVELGKSVRDIGANAFRYCENLTEITFPESMRTIGNGAFAYTGLVELVLPDGIISLGTDAESDPSGRYSGAFVNCDSLVTVVLPEGLTHIPNGCFSYCDHLEYVTFSDTVESIGKSAFEGCTELKTVDFGASLNVIGANAFYECGQLSQITFREGCGKNIGDYAFYATGITELILPDGPTVLSSTAFMSCNELTRIILPEGLEEIPDGCFYGLPKLESVQVSDSVKTIGKNAFGGCTALMTVDLGASVETIGAYAFGGCVALKTMDFGAKLQTIGENAFYECGQLSKITFQEGCGKNIGDYAFYATGITDLVLPNGPTVLSSTAFMSCNELTRIILPEGLEEIPDGCFYGLPKLESVQVSDSVKTIGENAFQYCVSLKTVDFGASLETIGAGAFYECGQLSRINFREGCGKTIGDYAFYATGITDIVLPDGPTVISGTAFMSCNELTRIVLPEGLEEIPEGCFYGLPKLESVQLSDSIKSIGANAFGNCTALKCIIFPESLEQIGDGALSECDSMEFVVFTGDAPAFGEGVFRNTVTKAYYPIDNPTWTKNVRQNYHGTVTWAPSYPVIDGNGTEWNEESETAVTVHIDAEITKFVEVRLNGKVVDPKYYTVTEGSTIITFKNDYLASLSIGQYTMTAVFRDGDAAIAFTIAEAEEAPGEDDDTILLGDVNEDGEIDILDANLVVTYYNEIASLTEEQLKAADVNGDGEVDIMDANMIVAYYNEIIDSFP